jgi:hypothetical protein
MADNNNVRDIIHELADTLAYLGDDYTLTGTECDPGDSAVRIIKRGSEKTVYIIAYSDPDDTEIRVYDEHDELTTQSSFYNGAFGNLYPEDVADCIRKSL